MFFFYCNASILFQKKSVGHVTWRNRACCARRNRACLNGLVIANLLTGTTCIWLSLGDTCVVPGWGVSLPLETPRFEVSLENFTQVGEVRAWKMENSLPLKHKGNFLGLKLAWKTSPSQIKTKSCKIFEVQHQNVFWWSMVSLARDSCALPDFFFKNVEVRNLEVDIYRRHKNT